MKKWKHEFYQNDPSTSDTCNFYHSQRYAHAILEEVEMIKPGLYKVRVVDIKSTEEFRIMGHGGGCSHQFKIGDVFTLRQHKNRRNYNWWCDYHENFWYDPSYRDHSYTERFILL